MNDFPKYVPSTVVIGRYGERVVTRGYTEIGGARAYNDMVVVGPYGQHQISKGWQEIVGSGWIHNCPWRRP